MLSNMQFVIRTSAGPTNLEEGFRGKNVEVDPLFRTIMKRIGPTFITQDFWCRVLRPKGGIDTDDVILAVAGYNTSLHKICAIVWHLASTHEGNAFLKISQGENAVSIVVGYASTGSSHVVLFIEHKIEKGKDVFCLRANPLNKWGNTTPIAIVAE